MGFEDDLLLNIQPTLDSVAIRRDVKEKKRVRMASANKKYG
jgi:hypothetical protein